MSANDGGYAFPRPLPTGEWSPDECLEILRAHAGMTVLDYFAVHSPQPGVSEIVTAAGLHCPDGFNVWETAEKRVGTFTQWWAGLTNEQRFDLSAKVKYQEAAAMLRARDAGSHP